MVTVKRPGTNGQHTDLATLAKRIGATIGFGEAGFRKGLDYFRQAGKDLLEAKKQVKHGEWEPWCKENFPKTTMRRIQQCMALAKTEVTADLEEQWRHISGNAPSKSQSDTDGIVSARQSSDSTTTRPPNRRGVRVKPLSSLPSEISREEADPQEQDVHDQPEATPAAPKVFPIALAAEERQMLAELQDKWSCENENAAILKAIHVCHEALCDVVTEES